MAEALALHFECKITSPTNLRSFYGKYLAEIRWLFSRFLAVLQEKPLWTSQKAPEDSSIFRWKRQPLCA
jgi:hypothetical protein